MTWDEFSAIASAQLASLLAKGDCTEKELQILLEKHPILVPGVYPLGSGHNGIFPAAVISQPPLSGIAAKIPDFCVIAWDSGTLYATFVEIESPQKKWATKAGRQSAALTQAVEQLRDWKIWFSNPLNSARFLEDFQVPNDISAYRAFVQKYILVYGRRDELQSSGFSRRRNKLQGADEEFMTWDRLLPSTQYSELMTVRLTSTGYRALTVPPTLTLGPINADYHALISERDSAIDASTYLTPTRGAFLKERWPYWDAWSRAEVSSTTSFRPASDVE